MVDADLLSDGGGAPLAVGGLHFHEILAVLDDLPAVVASVPDHRHPVGQGEGECGINPALLVAGGNYVGGKVDPRGQGHRVRQDAVQVPHHFPYVVVDIEGDMRQVARHHGHLGHRGGDAVRVDIVDLDVVLPVGDFLAVVVRSVPGSDDLPLVHDVDLVVDGNQGIAALQAHALDGLGILLQEDGFDHFPRLVVNVDAYRVIARHRAGRLGHLGGAALGIGQRREIGDGFPGRGEIRHGGRIVERVMAGLDGPREGPDQHGTRSRRRACRGQGNNGGYHGAGRVGDGSQGLEGQPGGHRVGDGHARGGAVRHAQVDMVGQDLIGRWGGVRHPFSDVDHDQGRGGVGRRVGGGEGSRWGRAVRRRERRREGRCVGGGMGGRKGRGRGGCIGGGCVKGVRGSGRRGQGGGFGGRVGHSGGGGIGGGVRRRKRGRRRGGIGRAVGHRGRGRIRGGIGGRGGGSNGRGVGRCIKNGVGRGGSGGEGRRQGGRVGRRESGSRGGRMGGGEGRSPGRGVGGRVGRRKGGRRGGRVGGGEG